MAINYKYAVDYNLSHLVNNEGKLDLSQRELTNGGVHHLASRLSGGRGKDNAETLSQLNLHNSRLDDGSIPALVRIVKNARHLKTLNISQNAFTGEGMEKLCKALEGHKGLKLLNIGTNPLGERGGQAVASLIRSGSTPMEELQAHHSSFGDSGLAAIGDAVRHSKSPLTRINLASNQGEAEAGKTWSEAITTHKFLSSVHLTQFHEEFDETVKDALSKSRNPNLTYVSPVNPRVAERTAFNGVTTRKAANLLTQKPETLTYDERAFTMQRLSGAQRTLMNGLPSYHYHVTSFNAHLDAMPPLPSINAGFAEALFQPNGSGYAPLDNPRNWEDWERVQKGLEASRVTPNQAFLQKTTPKGVNFLQSAAGIIPSAQLMSYLLKQGGKLGSDELLDGGKTPSPLFQAFIGRGDVEGIFAQENWIGKPKNELNAVYSALPEALQRNVPIHTLRQSTRPANQGLGR